MDDIISRQAAIDELKKCITCKHVYWRKDDADTMYCRCRKGCRYEDNGIVQYIKELPSVEPEIIYCKDCVKHNKRHGYYYYGMSIGIKDCCPLVEIRGRAQGHEFDYQFCAYAERRQDV